VITLRFAKQTQKFKDSNPDLVQHIQMMTDNLASVITRGLSYDSNLNSRIVKINVVSGRSFTLNAPELSGVVGASIINTNGAIVKEFRYQSTTRGELETVLTLDKDSTITFLLIGG
jgi:hypothetical protein